MVIRGTGRPGMAGPRVDEALAPDWRGVSKYIHMLRVTKAAILFLLGLGRVKRGD